MRLAFCFVSNNIHRFLDLKKSLDYDMKDSCITSFTINAILTPPFPPIEYIEGWNCIYKYYYFQKIIDMFTLRQDSLDMAKNSELIYMGDDDMTFLPGSNDEINQCCQYMKDNPDCGAIYLGGNFGGEGVNHGNEIYVTNNDYLATNRGIILRNKTVNIDNRLHALGSGTDTMIGFTCLMQGYYLARRLHTSILHNTDNILEVNALNPFYDLDYIRTKGTMKKVNEVIGEWTEFPVWPKNIFKLYRQAALVSGRVPRYDVDGNIIQLTGD